MAGGSEALRAHEVMLGGRRARIVAVCISFFAGDTCAQDPSSITSNGHNVAPVPLSSSAAHIGSPRWVSRILSCLRFGRRRSCGRRSSRLKIGWGGMRASSSSPVTVGTFEQWRSAACSAERVTRVRESSSRRGRENARETTRRSELKYVDNVNLRRLKNEEKWTYRGARSSSSKLSMESFLSLSRPLKAGMIDFGSRFPESLRSRESREVEAERRAARAGLMIASASFGAGWVKASKA